MILSLTLSVAVAIYCFFNGLVLAGVLCLVGIIPGAGMLALMIASIILVLNDHHIAAALPIIVICYNIWVLLVLRRED